MKCPLLNKECIREKCEWFSEFMMRPDPGKDPVCKKSCVVTEIPSILIELLRKTNSVGAAIESQRNEFVEKANVSNTILAGMGQIALENKAMKEIEGG